MSESLPGPQSTLLRLGNAPKEASQKWPPHWRSVPSFDSRSPSSADVRLSTAPDRLVMRADAFGAHPVYFGESEKGWAVSDRLDRLHREKNCAPLDRQGLVAFLMGPPLAPDSQGWPTLWTGLRRLPPDHLLILEPGGARIEAPSPPSHGPFPDLSDDELATRLLAALRLSVKQALAEPARSAVAFSGGLDSSALLAIGFDEQPGLIAAVLEDGACPPSEAAARTALLETCPAPVLTVRPDASTANDFARTVRLLEAPVFDGRAMAKAAFVRSLGGHGVTTLLTGTGADELFEPGRVRETGMVAGIRSALFTALKQDARERVDPEGKPRSRTEKILSETCPLVFPLESAPASAWGLTLRMPFLDPGFSSLALALPDGRCQEGGTTKAPLRRSLGDLLPDSVLEQAKTPAYARDGEIVDPRAWLTQRFFDQVGILDPATVRGWMAASKRRPAGHPEQAVLSAALTWLCSLAVLVNETAAG